MCLFKIDHQKVVSELVLARGCIVMSVGHTKVKDMVETLLLTYTQTSTSVNCVGAALENTKNNFVLNAKPNT